MKPKLLWTRELLHITAPGTEAANGPVVPSTGTGRAKYLGVQFRSSLDFKPFQTSTHLCLLSDISSDFRTSGGPLQKFQ